MIENLIRQIEVGGSDLSNTAVGACAIPDSVTIIGDGAFLDCYRLTRVTIPDSVTAIGDDAFYGCTGLTSVTIPNSVTHIGVGAFDCCPFLTVYVHDDEHAVMVRELGFEGNINIINND